MKAKKIKIISTLAAAVFTLTCLFVPWERTVDLNGRHGLHTRKPEGYACIFNAPVAPLGASAVGFRVDFARLMLEWAILVAVVGISITATQTNEAEICTANVSKAPKGRSDREEYARLLKSVKPETLKAMPPMISKPFVKYRPEAN